MYVDDSCKHGIGNAGGSRRWFDIGHSRQSQMILEEIHENLPVNSLLMDDGQLVKLPNFNRRYQVFDTYCSATDTTCHTSGTHSMTYKKLNDDSYLHIKWYGAIDSSQWESSPTFQTMKWYIVIDGAECTDPGSIEIWQVRRAVSYGVHVRLPKYSKPIKNVMFYFNVFNFDFTVEGTCKMPLAAGDHTISIRMANVDNSYPQIAGHPRGYGFTSTSYLMTEEVYPY